MDLDVSSLQILDQLQSDITGRLAADDYFSDVPVLAQNKGVVEDDIAQALATMTAKENGKMGAAVIVLSHERSVRYPNSPILLYDLSIVIRAMELPMLNRDPAQGTGKTCSAISLRIEHLLHQLVLDGITLVASRTGGFQQESGGLAADVTITFDYRLSQAHRAQIPVITIADGHATITCATTGAVIRYVISATEYPGAGSEIYAAPVALASGETIRAVATATGHQASTISEKTA